MGWGYTNVQFMVCDTRPGPEHRSRALADIYDFGKTLGAILPIPPRALRITLEAPTVARGGAGSTIPQAMASGALQAGLAAYIPTPVDLVMVPVWKKSVLSKGNASKAEIAQWVRLNHPDVYKLMVNDKNKVDQDMCDAFCIYLYAVKYEKIVQQIKRKRASL